MPEGIVGIITNHSFLDNPTFRGMRQSLMASFNKIYVLDLHGNAKKKEKSPDGSKDENVFDIEQGVAISLLIKTKPTDPAAASLRAQRSNPSSPASQPPQSPITSVNRADFHGTRLSKYESCARLSLNQVGWRAVLPATPFYLFESGDVDLDLEYRQAVSLVDIFPINSVGIVTARDDLAIQFSKADTSKTIRDFSNIAAEQARVKYGLGKDAEDWKVEWAQKDVRASGTLERLIIPILYRPFDVRWTYYTGVSRGFICRPRGRVMRHLIIEHNIALGVGRAGSAIPERTWELVTVFSQPFDANMFRRGLVAGFPLYYCKPETESSLDKRIDLFGVGKSIARKTRIENISPAFRTTINTTYGTSPALTPEQIFGYIYAILHAPTYRARYAEFLRGDFPRIPLAPGRENFESLAALGWNLAQKHLLKEIPANPVQYRGLGDNTVEKPRYAEAEQAAYINATQFFAPIPEPVWNFCIGGYQVIEKYLKSRKGRTLTLDEVTTIEHITAVLAYTITQMTEIDTAYLTAFPAHTT